MTREILHPTIFDRDTTVGYIKEHFSHTTELVREVVNFGSNLISRSLVYSERKVADIVIIDALFKQAVTMRDAIVILFSQGAVCSANLQVRNLLEARIYLAWILEKDKDQRAKKYLPG
jgi:hypothetical protein